MTFICKLSLSNTLETDGERLSVPLPVYDFPPLEYRVSLNVACAWLAASSPTMLICGAIPLEAHIRGRLSLGATDSWKSGVWVEPQVADWEADLDLLDINLEPGARLAVLFSLPPARYLPERLSWEDDPAGFSELTRRRLVNKLTRSGFTLAADYRIHTGQAIILNLLATLAARLGRFALSDRLGFRARRVYTRPAGKDWFATCALLLAAKR